MERFGIPGATVPKVIVDTDAGVDDGIALAILLAAQCLGLIKIEAITIGAGNTDVDNGAKNIMRILETVGKTNIPVYKGANASLVETVKFLDYFGKDGFGDLEWPSDPDMSKVQSLHAAIALSKLVTENPGELTILALGPLTNLAIAQRLNSQFLGSIKDLLVLGGNYQAVGNVRPTVEFNFVSDPEAAEVVLRETPNVIRLVPWEACKDIKITTDWRFNELGKIDNPLLRLLEGPEKTVYSVKTDFWNPADAVAAAVLLYPNTMVEKELYLPSSVELHGYKTRGQSVVDHFNSTTLNTVFITKINEKHFKKFVVFAAEKSKRCFRPSRYY